MWCQAVAERACAALVNLGANEGTREAICAEGGVEAVVEAMCRHCDVLQVSSISLTTRNGAGPHDSKSHYAQATTVTALSLGKRSIKSSRGYRV